VLGGADPVPVDRLDLPRIGIAVPADHEALGDASAGVDAALRHGRQSRAACRLRDERQHHHRRTGEVLAGLRLVDVDLLAQPPVRRHHRGRGLHVDPDVAGVHRQRERLGGRQTALERAVDQQSPDVTERGAADQLLDVDASVAQRAAAAVRLGDLGVECDDVGEARLDSEHALNVGLTANHCQH
jgi:hypothetical protein